MTPSKALSHYRAASMPDPDATPTSSECLPLTASDLDLRMDAIRAHKPITVPEPIRYLSEADERPLERMNWPELLTWCALGVFCLAGFALMVVGMVTVVGWLK